MIWAPGSELFGRRPIFLATWIPFCFFQIGCALAKNIETLLICRLLAGTIGSSPLTNSAGVIGESRSCTPLHLTDFHLCLQWTPSPLRNVDRPWRYMVRLMSWPKAANIDRLRAALLPFLGPCFGPIVGGYVGSENIHSWRTLFWITT